MTEQPSQHGTDSDAVILDAAADVFAANGFTATTVTMVARYAGVDVDALAARFPDPAQLLLAALTRRDDRDGADVAIFDQPGGVELLRGLKSMMLTDERKSREAKLHVRIVAEAIDPQHPAHGWAVERYQWMRSMFAAALRRDQNVGLIRPEVDPSALATRVIAMMDGLQLQWVLDGDATDMFAEFSNFIDELLTDISLPRG